MEGQGAVSGGLTDFSPAEEGRFVLDHDQRNTLSAGATVQIQRGAWVGGNLAYGSGFLEGDGPRHLPGHTTFDLATGMPLGNWNVKLTLINAANKRYLLDQSNTFGGTTGTSRAHFLGSWSIGFATDEHPRLLLPD